MLPRHLQEMGTHADLILAGGAYAKLVHRQIHRDPSYAQGRTTTQVKPGESRHIGSDSGSFFGSGPGPHPVAALFVDPASPSSPAAW